MTMGPSVAGKTAYDGFVITSIDVRRPYPNNPRRVEFSGRIKGSKDDTTAVILKNVVEVRKEGKCCNRAPVFEADEVDDSDVKAFATKPLLLYIHGMNSEPEASLKRCREDGVHFKNMQLIPVIWPCKSGTFNFFIERGLSIGAGNALKKSMALATMFPKKNVLAHSMGSRVLQYATDEKFKFDNIFMSAANVNRKLFERDYIEKTSNDGLRIKNMLNLPQSKIYVLHNRWDHALLASGAVLRRGRLGLKGARLDKLHPELQGKIENVNAKKFLKGIIGKNHNYQTEEKTIAFYESKCI